MMIVCSTPNRNGLDQGQTKGFAEHRPVFSSGFDLHQDITSPRLPQRSYFSPTVGWTDITTDFARLKVKGSSLRPIAFVTENGIMLNGVRGGCWYDV